MKFTCDKTVILKEISIAQEIISSRNALSILSNVLLSADKNTLLIKATDLKVSFETQAPVTVSRSGSATVFCDKFLGILRSLPDGDVEFEQTDNRLVIRPAGRKIDFQLKSIAADKFPELKDVATDKYEPFPQSDLTEMITQTLFAVSDDETRYFMNGVFTEERDGKLTMVATDGRRLSFVSRVIDGGASSFDGVIVPPKVLHLITKLASGEGTLSLAVSDKNIFVRIGGQKISSTLIDGQFPNYRRVIPEQQSYEAIVNHDELNEALKRVSLLVEQKSRRVHLNLRAGVLELKSEESEIGAAQEQISCDYKGPETSIALNYVYLAEPLRVMSDERIALRFTETTKAISLYPVPEKDYFHIIMPMQVD